MDFVLTKINIKLFTLLIKNYEKKVRTFSPEEFADQILSSEDGFIYHEVLIKHFLNYKRHEKIFECIFESFASITYKFKKNYKRTMLPLLYMLIFVLNDSNFIHMRNYCMSMNNMIFDLLMEYVNSEQFLILITEITCRIFDSEYTLSVVIQPLVKKVELLKLLHVSVWQCRSHRIMPKPVTQPKSPRLTKKLGKLKFPLVDPCDAPVVTNFISKKVPESTYTEDVVNNKLQAEFKKNRENALKLLEEAKNKAFSCARLREKTQKRSKKNVGDSIRSIRPSKAKKIPEIKPVNIKTNTTMLMREAAQMMKKCKEEIKKIDNLTTSSYNAIEVERIKEEDRRKQQTELLQNIQKKHLLGLLTREEAILAKQNVVKANKEKMEVFKEERMELYKKLEEWREKEQEKIQALIEKSQTIQKNAREAEKKSVEDKQKFVKQMQQETKELIDKAMKEQREKLNKKIELIKDLKELQSLKDLNKKEFDPTETCNLGLLCEMSIAELQERLFLLKVEVQDEVQKKKNLINKAKKQRQELLDQTKEFVAQNQTIKIKNKRENILVAEDTPEIIELRNRVAEVNGGSPAEKAGLIAGDSVVKVNNTDVFNLRHKDAQDVIVRAGPSFEVTVQRGGSTWKPAITPVGNLPKSQPMANNVSPVTKTSLAAQNQSYTPIGAAHNVAAKGFSSPQPHMNGDGPKLVNKQYNSPIGIYSEQSIAETLSAQSEVLSTGVLGVNFKKNEKTYNAEHSEVLKMLQEVEKEPRSPEPASESMISGLTHSPVTIPGIAGLRSVQAPETRPAPAPTTPTAAPGNPQLPPGQNICADCERLIVGVFVRIKDKNLHVECFKCATCGTSLKNVGYYNINHKLYCDIHAKLAARSNPPAPNMVPVTIPPGGKVPAGTISAALSSHSLSSPSPLSPSGNQSAAPFQTINQPDNNSYTQLFSSNNTITKDDAVANLMSVLTIATKKETKENGTNTEPYFVSEKIVPFNNNSQNVATEELIKEQAYPSATIKYMPFRATTGGSFSGPRPFSSVAPSTPSIAPVAPSFTSTLPKSASSTALPGRFSSVKPTTPFKEHVSPPQGCSIQEQDQLMPPIASEIYIPITDYDIPPSFNSIEFRAPVEVVKDKISSPDQEVFQIHASRSYDNSPVQFDGNLRNFVRSQLNTDQKVNNNYCTTKNMNEVNSKNNKKVMFQPDDYLVDGLHRITGAVTTTKMLITDSESNGSTNSDYSEFGLVSGQHPVCNVCNKEIIRGPFITALGKIWCPDHFICTTPSCRRPLQDMGFVEEHGQLYCEFCFEQYLAPNCAKCNSKIKGDCLNAIGKHFHPECFTCAYCSKLFGNSPFFLEDGLPYCEADWNELFTTKCFACGFPVEAGDRWVEALNNNYHSQCFNCTMCKKNLEGQSFYAKGGRPFCKNHAR